MNNGLILLPWVRYRSYSYFERHNLIGHKIAQVWRINGKHWNAMINGQFFRVDGDILMATSANEIMEYVDSELVSVGAKLLTAEQAEKLSLLL